jgi:hypothetical protein
MGKLKQSRREFLRWDTEFDLSREVDGACRQRREEHKNRQKRRSIRRAYHHCSSPYFRLMTESQKALVSIRRVGQPTLYSNRNVFVTNGPILRRNTIPVTAR